MDDDGMLNLAFAIDGLEADAIDTACISVRIFSHDGLHWIYCVKIDRTSINGAARAKHLGSRSRRRRLEAWRDSRES